MGGWRVVYYENEHGESDVRAFLDTLSQREASKVLAWIAQLEESGPNLPRPYAAFLGDGIHELRVRVSADQVRILYFFCHRRIIVLSHAFIKTTARVPSAQIRLARQRRADFLNRFMEGETG